MSRVVRVAGPALAVVLLAGCVSSPVREAPVAVDQEWAQAKQRERQAQLQAIVDWSMQGRLALSVGTRGGSGRLDWRQRGPTFEVSLAAPVTRQSWRLAGEPGRATLDGLEGGARSGPDAGALLQEATGWPIPVDAMAWWVRGLASPGGEIEFGTDGRPRRLVAEGWVVDYQEWLPANGAWPDMPRRLQAVRGDARVRLVVDGWEASP